jgi:hypothetical protein
MPSNGMADYLGLQWHERARPSKRVDYRNGFYERDYVTTLGVIRLRIPRTRQRSFLPRHSSRPSRREVRSTSVSAVRFLSSNKNEHKPAPVKRANRPFELTSPHDLLGLSGIPRE